MVANAITHGTPPVTLTITTTDTSTGRTVVVAVHDCGRGGRRIAAETAPPGPDRLHGRGLLLATRLCDRIDARTDAGGTTITLTVTR